MSKTSKKIDVKAMEKALADERKTIEGLMYNTEIDDRQKKYLTQRVIKDVETDSAAREEYMEKRREILQLYEGKKEMKSDPFPNCYSEDTEVLTKSGWRLVKEVTKKDYVYSMNPKTGISEWMPVIETEQAFHKELLHFKSNSVDLLVSADHNMVVFKDSQSNLIKFIKASKLFGHWGHKRIPLTSKRREGESAKYVYGFKTEDWMSFLGWYVSEGCMIIENGKHGTICIAQSITANPQKCAIIEDLLKRMKVNYSYSSNRTFLVSSKSLPRKARDELYSLGKCHQKYIPRKYMDFSRNSLLALLTALIAGDGCCSKGRKESYKDKVSYFTTSKQLADDVQELTQKVGGRATIIKRPPVKERHLLGYVVGILWRTKARVSRMKKSRVAYNGPTYCLTTPYHTLYVRRNGIACWCGNCSNVQTMIISMVAELLHSKLFPIAYNEELTYWVPQEKSDIAQAEGVSRFMPWALRRCRFRDFTDDYVQAMVLEGTTVTKVTWDSEFRWVARKVLRPTAVLRRYKAKLKDFLGIEHEVEIIDKDYSVEYEYKKIEHAKAELIPLDDIGFPVYSIPGSDENKLQHIWQRTRPYIDELEVKEKLGYFENLQKVHRGLEQKLVDEGALQQEKTEAEGSEYAITKDIAMESKALEVIEWYGKVSIPGKGRVECIVWIEKTTETFLGIMPLLALSRKNRRPFVIGQFIRRSHRMYGKTVLDFVTELQKEVDTIHNQRLDAGTMAIVPPMIARAASGLEPEEIQLTPGKVIYVDDVNTDLKWMQIPNNVVVSFQEERMLLELIEKITSVGAYQSGQESDIIRSRSTARGTMAIIAQGEQRFQTLAKRVQGPLARILVKILEQYQQNIPPGLEERVLGDDGEKIFPSGLSAEDLIGSFDVVQGLDATGGSKQVQKENDINLYMALIQNPLILNNPEGLWELTSMILSDAGKVNPERYLGPKPKPQQGMGEAMVDPASSIRRWIGEIQQGREPKLEPTENPMQLLTALLAWKNSPEGLALEPEKVGLLDIVIGKLKITLLNQQANAASMAQVAEGMLNARQTGIQPGAVEGVGEGTSPRIPSGPDMGGATLTPSPEALPGQAPGATETGQTRIGPFSEL